MESCCVSVIMPCYNDGRYIEESIRSLKNQTFTDYELIVIDDGSDDPETLRILSALPDDHIRLLHTDHVRPAGARNHGIRQARGKYILPLDSDDLIEPTYLEKAVRILDENENIGIVYCYADLFGCRTGRWDLPDYSREQMLLDNVIFVTALFRREDWAAVGGFKENMDVGIEDYDFWLALLELGREVHQIPEVLFRYRIKETSRTTEFKQNCEQMQRAYRTIFENHRKLYQDNYDLIIPALRDRLVEQTFIREKMERGLRILEPIRRNKFLKKLLKRFL